MSFPHNYNDIKAQEVHFGDGRLYKGESHISGPGGAKSDSMYPSAQPAVLKNAKPFAQALYDMCCMEGALEKKRRELALQPDFNIGDTYKMFA